MADALDSKSGAFTGVRVRSPPPVPTSSINRPDFYHFLAFRAFFRAQLSYGITGFVLPEEPQYGQKKEEHGIQ